jgi:hypothetical protein
MERDTLVIARRKNGRAVDCGQADGTMAPEATEFVRRAAMVYYRPLHASRSCRFRFHSTKRNAILLHLRE